MEDMVRAELDEHLGYERHGQQPKQTSNRRNGMGEKKVLSHSGELSLRVSREQKGSFEPQIVRKGQHDISGIQEKVMSMYTKWLSGRDLSVIIKDIYRFEVSYDTISRIVEQIEPRFTAWQSRTLEPVYAFVYVDAMAVKVK